MKWFAALVVGCLAAPALAGTLELDGPLIQGSLIFGTTEAGAQVSLDGRPLRVSPSGRFLLGFGRDAKPEAKLEVVHPDGSRETRSLAIESRAYKVQRIDGLPPKLVTPDETAMARIKADIAQVAKARAGNRPEALFESGFAWPATGIITGVYGSQRILNGKPRQPHFGLDVAGPEGTPIKAPADGIVTLAEPDMYFSGGTLILDHGHGLSSSLLHLKELLVAPGERVSQGQVVATMGATGRVTGVHLDWRINWFTERLDPAFLVGPMPPSDTKN
jgi:murein DD-endopeptidase MepM/ murein hydrolase activator NlpD